MNKPEFTTEQHLDLNEVMKYIEEKEGEEGLARKIWLDFIDYNQVSNDSSCSYYVCLDDPEEFSNPTQLLNKYLVEEFGIKEDSKIWLDTIW